MLVVLIVVFFSKKSEKMTANEADDRLKNSDAIATEIKHKEWYLSDFAEAEFFDDSKSPDPERRKVGSSFGINSCRMSDGVRLILNQNNWGTAIDYQMRDDGFVESITTVKGEDMERLMKLCDYAENGREVVEYLHKRFSPDGYRAYINILQWSRDNNIGVSCWSN